MALQLQDGLWLAAEGAANLFPLWVLAAAAWGLARPAAFAWFGPGLATTALASSMLAIGLALSLEVRRPLGLGVLASRLLRSAG